MRPFALVLVTCSLCAQVPQEPARIQVFEATPKAVKAGEPVELNWSATNTDRIRLEPLDQDLPAVGHVTYVPRERTVFWIHASNARGGQSMPLVVEMISQNAPALPGRSAGSGTPPPSAGIWIQFAALTDAGSTERLSKELSRLTGATVAQFDIDDPGLPGQRLHRLRIGPFSSIGAARTRLRSLQPKLGSLHIKPFVAVD
jgi:SPOR domain